MCLILFAINQNPEYPFVLIANRDEFFERPTTKANFWPDHPQVLAGRDEEAGGTWLGLTKQGRFAAVTNFRSPELMGKTFPSSRGELTSQFLCSDQQPFPYLESLRNRDSDFSGYNLLVGQQSDWAYYSNQSQELKRLEPGFYGMSNHLLDTPWPKLVKAKHALQQAIDNPDHAQLMPILLDSQQARTEELPDTGVGLEMEAMLSPIKIEAENYGTRCSTVVTIRKDGWVSLTERTHNKDRSTSDVQYEFLIEAGH